MSHWCRRTTWEQVIYGWYVCLEFAIKWKCHLDGQEETSRLLLYPAVSSLAETILANFQPDVQPTETEKLRSETKSALSRSSSAISKINYPLFLSNVKILLHSWGNVTFVYLRYCVLILDLFCFQLFTVHTMAGWLDFLRRKTIHDSHCVLKGLISSMEIVWFIFCFYNSLALGVDE